MSIILRGTILAETDKAIQFAFGEDQIEWFPLSQIDKIKRTQIMGKDEIVISDWIAGKKGIEDGVEDDSY